MIVKNENEIEIWNDGVNTGKAKETLLSAIALFVLFYICLYMINPEDFTMPDFLKIGGLIWLIIMIILSFLLRRVEKQNKRLIAKINKEYIQIYKKKTLKIEMSKIEKIKSVSGDMGNFIVILYKENDKTKKTKVAISQANIGLFETAIKEMNNEIQTEKYNFK